MASWAIPLATCSCLRSRASLVRASSAFSLRRLGVGQCLLRFGSGLAGVALGERRVVAGGPGIGHGGAGSLAWDWRYKKLEVPAQKTTRAATAALKAASFGLRRHQRPSRSARPTGRAEIGSPARKRRRSSASCRAVA